MRFQDVPAMNNLCADWSWQVRQHAVHGHGASAVPKLHLLGQDVSGQVLLQSKSRHSRRYTVEDTVHFQQPTKLGHLSTHAFCRKDIVSCSDDQQQDLPVLRVPTTERTDANCSVLEQAAASGRALVFGSAPGILRRARRFLWSSSKDNVCDCCASCACFGVDRSNEVSRGPLCQKSSYCNFESILELFNNVQWGEATRSLLHACALCSAMLQSKSGWTGTVIAQVPDAIAAFANALLSLPGIAMSKVQRVQLVVLLGRSLGHVGRAFMASDLPNSGGVAAGSLHEAWVPVTPVQQAQNALEYVVRKMAQKLDSLHQTSTEQEMWLQEAEAALSIIDALLWTCKNARLQSTLCSISVPHILMFLVQFCGCAEIPIVWSQLRQHTMMRLLCTLDTIMGVSLPPASVGESIIRMFTACAPFHRCLISYTEIALQRAQCHNTSHLMATLRMWSRYVTVVCQSCPHPNLNMPDHDTEQSGRTHKCTTAVNESEDITRVEAHLCVDEGFCGRHENGNETTHPTSSTREEAMMPLNAVVSVPGGVVMRTLQMPFCDALASVHSAALSLLQAVFSCSGSPVLADETVTSHFVQHCYVTFLRLYLSPKTRLPAMCSAGSSNLYGRQEACSETDNSMSAVRKVCIGHLRVLLALASCKLDHIRYCFLHQGTVAFIRAELSLELHAHRHVRMECLRDQMSGEIQTAAPCAPTCARHKRASKRCKLYVGGAAEQKRVLGRCRNSQQAGAVPVDALLP